MAAEGLTFAVFVVEVAAVIQHRPRLLAVRGHSGHEEISTGLKLGVGASAMLETPSDPMGMVVIRPNAAANSIWKRLETGSMGQTSGSRARWAWKSPKDTYLRP